MGMYDTVLVPCPNCGHKNEIQSKGGDCFLNEYELHDAPTDVLSDINRHAPHECEKCESGFSIHLKTIATVTR